MKKLKNICGASLRESGPARPRRSCVILTINKQQRTPLINDYVVQLFLRRNKMIHHFVASCCHE